MEEDKDFSLQIALEGYYESICESADFADEVMLPQLRSIRLLSHGAAKPIPKKEEYLMQFYERVCLWIKSVKALNNAVHFQAVASAARSIFELLVDIKLLADNSLDDSVDRIDAFIQIEKIRIATQYIAFKKDNPDLEYIKDLKREAVVNKPGELYRIEKLKKKYWNKKNGRIEHWTGWHIKQRLKKAGKKYELLYYESVSLWNWYVHSAGLTGTRGMSGDGLKAMFGRALDKIVDIFCDISDLVAKELKLKSAMPNFDKWMIRIRTTVGRVILEKETKKGPTKRKI